MKEGRSFPINKIPNAKVKQYQGIIIDFFVVENNAKRNRIMIFCPRTKKLSPYTVKVRFLCIA